jgi:hypothetical protein
MKEAQSHRCAGCSRGYAASAWRDLPQICTLDGADVAPFVVSWPAGCVVEVRACRSCGRPIARTVTRGSERDPAATSTERDSRASRKLPGVCPYGVTACR